jgi:hypothetical protein
MKILSIGNSFSQDSQRYLHRLAKADGFNIKSVNLYIGGCDLRRHYLNMLDDKAAYDFEFNGENTGIKVSISEALASDNWDYVTIQQQSAQSTQKETFTPYIEELVAYVRRYCPKAKIVLVQTWAYEKDSEKLRKLEIYDTPEQMLDDIRASYEYASSLIGADGMIPAGEAMQKALELGMEKIHRDTFHASLGAGRYLLALCWYKALSGRDISLNTFDEFDVPVTEDEREIVIKAVSSLF